jgi:hypothetical protein
MNFRKKAASFVLCNDDITEALELLENSDTIPDEVTVWEKFEDDSIEDIIEYIDAIESMLEEAYEEGTRNLNLKLMNREQLIDFIHEHSKDEFETPQSVFELAKESEQQLHKRVKSIANYLAGKID